MGTLSIGSQNPAPLDYTTPPFPSLYSPIKPKVGDEAYLYYSADIWRFTLLWTLLVYGAVHLAAGAYAVAMQRKNWKFVWVIPVTYAVVAGVEAVIAGSVVGLILGAIYSAGYFRMSTWIPFIWAVINVLVLILSSFSIQGGL
ncbi:MAG: hypothetical protein M1832_000268 [Thelocarpon impressellum]|nr:MAG: hypothetical protein M1832_000268 [Thelocarpon impressellum]